jgi:hypothetical protein
MARSEKWALEPTKDKLLAELGEAFSLDIVKGPWLVGGLVRRVVCGDPLDGTDIDIAYRPEATIPEKYEPRPKERPGCYFAKGQYVTKSKLVLNTTHFNLDRNLLVPERCNVYEVLEPFTLTCCQFATDGRVVVYSRQGYADAVDKVARLVMDQPYSGKKLIEKYMTQYEFTATPEVLDFLRHGIELTTMIT